jgi:hypothetical protein
VGILVACVTAADLGKQVRTRPADQGHNGKPKPHHIQFYLIQFCFWLINDLSKTNRMGWRPKPASAEKISGAVGDRAKPCSSAAKIRCRHSIRGRCKKTGELQIIKTNKGFRKNYTEFEVYAQVYK